MKPCVIDASVAAKWFFEEDHSSDARSLLSDEPRHAAPDFILTELASIGLKRVRRSQASAENVREAPARAAAMLILHGTRPLVPAALELALVFGLSVYDGLYVALASLLEQRLITADRRLYNALTPTQIGGTVLWIGDVPRDL